MKKDLSVLFLATRLICPTLCIALLTAAAQGVALYLCDPAYIPLEKAMDESFASVLGLAGLLALMATLCVKGAGYGSRTRYTVGRLGITERKFNLLWAAAFAACYAVFWATQVAALMLLTRHFFGGGDALTVAVAWYRHPYLHNLWPARDGDHWLALALMLPVLGMSTAHFAAVARRGRFGLTVLMVAVCAVLTFGTTLRDTGSVVAISVAWIILFLLHLYFLLRNVPADERGGEET